MIIYVSIAIVFICFATYTILSIKDLKESNEILEWRLNTSRNTWKRIDDESLECFTKISDLYKQLNEYYTDIKKQDEDIVKIFEDLDKLTTLLSTSQDQLQEVQSRVELLNQLAIKNAKIPEDSKLKKWIDEHPLNITCEC